MDNNGPQKQHQLVSSSPQNLMNCNVCNMVIPVFMESATESQKFIRNYQEESVSDEYVAHSKRAFLLGYAVLEILGIPKNLDEQVYRKKIHKIMDNWEKEKPYNARRMRTKINELIQTVQKMKIDERTKRLYVNRYNNLLEKFR